MKQILSVCILLVLFTQLATITSVSAIPISRENLAANYLSSHYNKAIGLIYESEDDSTQWFNGTWRHYQTYWIYSDNFFASLALSQFNPKIALQLNNTLKDYTHLNQTAYSAINGIPITNPKDMIVNTVLKTRDVIVLTNTYNDSSPANINTNYADSAVYKALSLYELGYKKNATNLLRTTYQMWNGTCVVDDAVKAKPTMTDREWTNAGFCANYKIGLLLFASKVIGLQPPENMEPFLWSMQLKNGGIASLSRAGKPIGSANAETTSLTLLQYNSFLIQHLNIISAKSFFLISCNPYSLRKQCYI